MAGSFKRTECDGCGLCYDCLHPFMMGSGPLSSSVLFVGEAPGAQEDKVGVPFVGESGKLFNAIIDDLEGWTRDTVRVENAVRCRPPGNREPTVARLKACFPLLLDVIRAMPNLRVVVTMGNSPLHQITGKKGVMTERGRWREVELAGKNLLMLPTLHPAYLLRNPGHLDPFVRDLEAAHKVWSEGVPDRPSVNYRRLVTQADWDEFNRALAVSKLMGYDFETDSLEYWSPALKVLGVSFCPDPFSSWFAPLDHPQAGWLGAHARDRQKDRIVQTLLSPVKKVDHNGRFDRGVAFYQWGIKVANVVFDTSVGFHFIDEEASQNGGGALEDLEWRFLMDTAGGRKMAALGEADRANLAETDLDTVSFYGCGDSDSTLQLVPFIKKSMRRDRIPLSLMELEIRKQDAVARMQARGAVVDWAEQERAMVRFSNRMRDMAEEIRAMPEVHECEELLAFEEARKSSNSGALDMFAEMPGRVRFNPRSHHHRKLLAFAVSELPADPDLLTDGGKEKVKTREELTWDDYALDQDILGGYVVDPALSESQRDVALKLKRWAQMQQLFDNFLSKLPGFRNRRTGLVHSNMNPHRMVTWRNASSSPNLQNLPRAQDDEWWLDCGPSSIKRLYIPGDHHELILEADLSQVELRMAGLISQDPAFIECYKTGIDVHRRLAARAFKVPLDQVTSTQRSRVKPANFGAAYDRAAPSMSREFQMPLADCEHFLRSFDEEFVGFARWKEGYKEQIRRTGVSRSLFGHVRHLPDAKSAQGQVLQRALRKGANFPIQCTASSLFLYAMTMADEMLMEYGFRSEIFLTVYDSCLLRVVESELEDVAGLLKECLENQPFPWLHGCPDYPEPIQMVADMKTGPNLADLKDFSLAA